MAKNTKKKKPEIDSIPEPSPEKFNIHLNLDKIEFEVPTITLDNTVYKLKPIDYRAWKKIRDAERELLKTGDYEKRIEMLEITTEIPKEKLEGLEQHILNAIQEHIILSAGSSKKKEKKSE